MRLSIAQMSMLNEIDRNINKSIQFLDLADTHKADIVVFPQLSFTPYFPQYRKREVGGALNHIPAEFAVELSDKRLSIMQQRCSEYGIYASPNFYLNDQGIFYDTSVWIDNTGQLHSGASMHYAYDQPSFHEAEYFTGRGSDFFVYDTIFGKVGIVIAFDRHIPECVSACVKKGADLVLIPVANTETEPLLMYELEIRTLAFQNGVFVAMANRVGTEGEAVFAGGSMVADPNGDIVVKADDSQQFVICSIELQDAKTARKKRPYRSFAMTFQLQGDQLL